jgi:hypothetical protein
MSILTSINGNTLHKPELFPLYRCKENKVLTNKNIKDYE